MWEDAASLGAGLLGGLVSGLLGFGGGTLIPPVLVVALGLSQHAAQGISLGALLPPVGWPAVRAYQKAGVRVHRGLVGALLLGFFVGTAGGGWLAQLIPEDVLRLGFGGFLLVVAARTAWTARRVEPEVALAEAGFSWVAVGAGVLGGFTAGLVGVGGGLVVGPLLQRWLKLPPLQAQAATLMMMLAPVGFPAFIAYVVGQGGLPWRLLVAVGVGFALGAGVGGRLATKWPSPRLRVTYSLVLAAMAALLLLVPGHSEVVKLRAG